MQDINIEKVREDTAACEKIIHFNNAGASLMPIPVSQAMHSYLDSEEHIGGYETQRRFDTSLNDFYSSAAKLINCSESEIAFVENASRGWGFAFYSFEFNAGDKFLTSLSEYGSNVVAYLQQAKRYGVEIEFIPNDSSGQVDIRKLKEMIDSRVKLISITHIPTGGGLVNPARAIGDVARSEGIPFILDTCQSIGHIPVDVEDIGCDVLCATGRKYLRGPRGTGFMYVRQSLLERLEPIMMDNHSAALISPDQYVIRNDARRFESWEHNVAGKYALTKAIDYSLNLGLDAIQQRVYHLANTLRQSLKDIENISVADQGEQLCGIVTFYSEKVSANKIAEHLSLKNINVSIAGCAGSMIDFHHRGIKELVRASVHYFNTEEEIKKFTECIAVLMEK